MSASAVLSYLAPVLPYLAPALPAVPSLLDQTQKRWKRLLVLITLVMAWGLVYRSEKGHQAELAQSREEAAKQATRAEGLRIQNQVLHRDLQARVRAVEEISHLIAEGCIRDPKLRKQADAVHTKLTRDGPEEIEAQIRMDPKATAVKNERKD